LLACGAKKIETRSWKTNYRGLLAIHASKGTQYMQLATQDPFRSALRNEELHTGCIIAVGELWKIERIRADDRPDEPERSFGDYTPGRYGWFIRDVKRLSKPLPINGSLGVWECNISGSDSHSHY
jgi:hypothetical protein